MNNRFVRRNTVVLLCMILMFVYVSPFFVPHIHDTHGQECGICILLDAYRNLFNVFLLTTSVSFILNRSFGVRGVLNNIHIFSDDSLVGLKVKLSD